MKRLIVVALSAALMAGVVPATAGPMAEPQEETGNVLMPAPGPNGETTGGCWTGWSRRAWIVSGGSTAGPFGSMFEIDESTWGGKFKLDVAAGGAGTEDLDITFYADPGQIDPADPAQQAGIIETGSYLSRKAGGEEGTVPETSTVALICLAIGSGFNADWEYTATPVEKKKKKTKKKK